MDVFSHWTIDVLFSVALGCKEGMMDRLLLHVLRCCHGLCRGDRAIPTSLLRFLCKANK